MKYIGYHGTNKELKKIKPFMFFAKFEGDAIDFGYGWHRMNGEEFDTSIVYTAELDFKNPFIFKEPMWYMDEIQSEEFYEEPQNFANKLKKKGYDSIIDETSHYYFSFYPSQIKIIDKKIHNKEETNNTKEIEAASITPTQPKPTESAGPGLIWAWEPTSNMWIRVKEDEAISTVKQQNQPSYVSQPTQQNQQTTMYTTATISDKTAKEFEEKLAFLANKGNYYSKSEIDERLVQANFLEYAGYNIKNGAQYKITKSGLDFIKNYNLNTAKQDLENIKISKSKKLHLKAIKDIKPIEEEVDKLYSSQQKVLKIEFKDKIEAKMAKDILFLNNKVVEQQNNELLLKTNKITSSLKENIKNILLNDGFLEENFKI